MTDFTAFKSNIYSDKWYVCAKCVCVHVTVNKNIKYLHGFNL